MTKSDLRAKLIEAGADAMVALPFDTLELRNWGQESIADPTLVLSTAVLDAFLDCLAENADEASDVMAKGVGDYWTHQTRRALGGLLAVLRDPA